MILDYFSNPSYTPTILIITAIIMVMALIFHNMVQAYVASRYGDNGPKFSGFMRFDPQVHLEPFGVLFLFLLGFGWPKPIPTNSRNYSGRGKQEALVWYSGPAAYLVVSFVSYLLARIFLSMGQTELFSAFANAGSLAILHGVINLFPVYPLDGAKAALAWGSPEVRKVVQQIAQFGFIGFIVIFFVLSSVGVTGGIIAFFRALFMNIINVIPGL